jgi:hypothetical protein
MSNFNITNHMKYIEKTGIIIVSVIVLLLFSGFNLLKFNPEDEYLVLNKTDNDSFLFTEQTLDYSDYKNWYHITKDNPNTGDPTGFLGGKHKGIKAYREVYINAVGEQVNKGTAPYKYPPGTVIIKEEYKNKKSWESGKNPTIKVMLKLSPGESPETGDWGFASNLNSKKIAKGKSGKAKFCSGCHVFVATNGDYVFMNSDFLQSE